jgi:rubredoxin
MRRWKCRFCNHVYSEAEGDVETGILPGSALEDLPDDWVCPDCGATKDDYELIGD